MAAWRDRHSNGDRPFSPNVYSGSASNIGYARAFERDTGFSFHSGIIDTPDYVAEACELLPLYGIPIEDAALLKEDESGYSNSFEPPPAHATVRGAGAPAPCALRTYVFPRDISHLRNAYQEATGSVRDPYSSQTSNLNFSIRDPTSGDDSIPVFSKVQTPLTRDAIIDSIARDFNRRNTRVVFIAAANTLDTLFLMRAIRQDSPNTRILTENPHVLMIPAASREDLAGAILLSTYPMFPEGEAWLDTYRRKDKFLSGKDVLNFSDSVMQGVFNVSQLLLQDIGALPEDHEPDLRAYRGFQGGHGYPGIWFLTLNRFGFLPLDMHGSEWPRRSPGGDPCPPGKDCGWMKTDADAVPPAFPSEIVPLRNWRVTAALVNLSILLLCSLLLWCNISPAARKPLWFALNEPFGPRLQALLGLCLSLTAFDWILIGPDLAPLSSFLPPDNPLLLLFHATCLLGLAAPLAVFSYLVFLLWRRARTGASSCTFRFGIRAFLYTAAALAFFGEIVVRWYGACFGPGAAAFFFRLRALDLYSGSSPAMPLLILTLVCFCVALLYFKRYTLAGSGRPRMEFAIGENDSPHAVLYQKRLVAARDAIEEQILAPSTLRLWPSCARAAVGILFAACSLKLFGKYTVAFERPNYNWMLLAELTVILFWLAIGCYDLILLWKRVKQMLDLVDLLPIEAAVERVAREWPRRPIWTFRKSVSSARINRQMRYALLGRLAALRNGTEKVAAAAASASTATVSVSDWTVMTTTTPASAAEDLESFLKVVEDGEGASGERRRLRQIVRGKDMPGAHRALVLKDRYEKESARLAALVLKQDLRPSWRRSGMSEGFGKRTEDREPLESQFQQCCANFVALHCCRFVTYAIEHIQRIATCVSLAFLLLVVFFNSYSPQGPQLVARYLAGIFLILGAFITRIFAQMERNPLLSRIARSQPGELNREFWIQLATLGGLPLLGVLSHLFPALSQFLFQWVAPGVQALH